MNFQFQKFSKLFIAFLLAFALIFSLPRAVSAHCPLCVGGAAAGLTLSRLLGIDDSITGVWLAALTGALAFWTDSWLSKKRKISFAKPLIYIGFFGFLIWPLYAFNDYFLTAFKFVLINRHAGQIFGVDKLTFGILSGAIVFYIVDLIDDLVIKRHGKVYFQFQRVIVPLLAMLVLSLGIYILINYYI